MEVKIDTKEKFHVITWYLADLSATMTDELGDRLLLYLHSDIKNVILNLKELQSIDNVSAEKLVNVQQKFYESGASFVICELQRSVEEFLDRNHLLELMNVTPSESEAWDIIQLEEIERELFDDSKEAS